MKKLIRMLLLAVVLISGGIVVVNKPSEADFASWMEDAYELQCLDEACDVFQLESENEQIVMQSVQGGFSPGIFVARMDKTYRNDEDPSYHLEIKASGFLNDITIKKETMQGMRKR